MSAKPIIRSPLWSRVLIFLLLIGLALWTWYAWTFYRTVAGGPDARAFESFIAFRQQYFSLLSFYLVFLIFAVAFWAYSLFADMNNLYFDFEYRPSEAAIYAATPLLNIYGLGWMLTRLVRLFDHEKLRVSYRHVIHPLKVSIAFIYAGIFGLVVSAYFALSLPLDQISLFKAEYIGFTAIELLLFFFTLLMFILTVYRTRAVVRLGMEHEEWR